MDRIAIFDVDYTLTRRETQVELVRFMIKKNFSNIRFLPNSILAGLGNVLKLKSDKAAKEQNLKMLAGTSEEELHKIAREFFDKGIRPILYKDSIKAIRRHHSEGMRVILSSASPDFYIREFERSPFIEKALGTTCEIRNGVLTGRILGNNHKGMEKVHRLNEYLDGQSIDWDHSVMYSDSLSDSPLMDLVGKAYLINHRPTDRYPVLKWK